MRLNRLSRRRKAIRADAHNGGLSASSISYPWNARSVVLWTTIFPLIVWMAFTLFSEWGSFRPFIPRSLPTDEMMDFPTTKVQQQERRTKNEGAEAESVSSPITLPPATTTLIAAEENVVMTEIQETQANATETTHDVIAKNKKAIYVYTNMNINRDEPCDIPCTYTNQPSQRLEADASVYERRGYQAPAPDDRFAIYLQMEGDHYYPISLDGYHLENSYRWQSPLLKPYFEWIHYQGRYNISNPAVSWNDTINGASFIAHNCNSLNGREKIVEGIRGAGVRVDGLSTCLNNKSRPQVNDKLLMLKPYKFTLAFENGNLEDYVTEKVYQALASGTLPVYMGAPNIREYVPDKSIIDVADFDFNTTLLAEHLKECMHNQTLYESYHAWRTTPLPEWFVRRFNFTWASTECRTCRYLYALSNGLEWDKENQRGIERRYV